jgi:hypothetical protein
VDERLSDPLYPDVSPDRWHVVPLEDGSGDLELIPPEATREQES